jgi:hypothetical protein
LAGSRGKARDKIIDGGALRVRLERKFETRMNVVNMSHSCASLDLLALKGDRNSTLGARKWRLRQLQSHAVFADFRTSSKDAFGPESELDGEVDGKSSGPVFEFLHSFWFHFEGPNIGALMLKDYMLPKVVTKVHNFACPPA